MKVLTSYLTQIRESFNRSLLFFLIGVSVFLGSEAKSRLQKNFEYQMIHLKSEQSQETVCSFKSWLNSFVLEFFCIPAFISSESWKKHGFSTPHSLRTRERNSVTKSEALFNICSLNGVTFKSIWHIYILRALFLIEVIFGVFLVRLASPNSEVEEQILILSVFGKW